jgi:hypothetical protein
MTTSTVRRQAPTLSGYGPPRDHDAHFIPEGSPFVVMTFLPFAHPAALWRRSGSWQLHLHADRPDLDDLTETNTGTDATLSVVGMVVLTAAGYYQRTGSEPTGPGHWTRVYPIDFDEVPGPTITAEPTPGQWYIDTRPNSDWYQLDEGEWVALSGRPAVYSVDRGEWVRRFDWS